MASAADTELWKWAAGLLGGVALWFGAFNWKRIVATVDGLNEKVNSLPTTDQFEKLERKIESNQIVVVDAVQTIHKRIDRMKDG